MRPTNMRKCSSSLVIREMQIKSTLKYYFIPVRIAIIKNSGDNRCWRGCGELGTLLHYLWECKLVQPLWKAVAIPQGPRNRNSIWPSNPITGYISKGL